MLRRKGRIAGIAAALLTAAGLAGAAGAAALAAPAAVSAEKFSVEVVTDGHTYMPNTSFSFQVRPADANEYGGQTTKAGADGGVTVDRVVFRPSEGLADPGHQGTITYHAEKFTAPGIYHYTLQGLGEDPQTGSPYEGIRYDLEVRDLYVYVQNAGSGGGMEVFGSAIVKRGSAAKNEGFRENYGNEDEPDPNDSTHDVTLMHKVTGNQGDTRKDFPYKVKITGTDGEKYKIAVDGNTVLTSLDSGQEASFTLRDGQKVSVYGLSENDRYEFTAVDANKDGYTTTYAGSMTGTVKADGTAVTATYDRNVAAATGVMFDFAPFGILTAAAAGVVLTAGMSSRKKR